MKDCVSLEVARRLKEAGWKTMTDSVWKLANISFDPEATEIGWILETIFCPDDLRGECFAAPTIGELLEALPKTTIIQINRDEEKWVLARMEGTDPTRWEVKDFMTAYSLADCLALLWLALKEKNLL